MNRASASDFPSVPVARSRSAPHYNNLICRGTRDGHALLFPRPIEELVDRHGGFDAGWAAARGDGAIELGRSAPSAFFDELLVTLRTIGAGRS